MLKLAGWVWTTKSCLLHTDFYYHLTICTFQHKQWAMSRKLVQCVFMLPIIGLWQENANHSINQFAGWLEERGLGKVNSASE